MSTSYVRPNVFEIDLQPIADRVRDIRATIGPAVRFFATLKADAYGFGLLHVAKTVLAAGADAISLVNLADAIALREAGIDCPILVYAGTLPEREIVAAHERYRLIPTLHDDASLDAYARHANTTLPCAVKVDIGQERIGVPADAAAEFLAKVAANGNLKLALVNAHPYVSPHEGARDALEWQYERFQRVCDVAERRGVEIPLRMLASSKVLGLTRKMNLTGVDPGQGLFGGTADASPFSALRTRLIEVKGLSRDAHLEHAPFPVRDGMRLGIVPIGYSDGLGRLNAGVALVRGHRVPVLAQPSLEYTRIDVSGVPDAAVGDEVVFIGRQGETAITPGEVMRSRGIARLSDLALEVKHTIPRVHLAAR